jgi:hypothetical protein
MRRSLLLGALLLVAGPAFADPPLRSTTVEPRAAAERLRPEGERTRPPSPDRAGYGREAPVPARVPVRQDAPKHTNRPTPPEPPPPPNRADARVDASQSPGPSPLQPLPPPVRHNSQRRPGPPVPPEPPPPPN